MCLFVCNFTVTGVLKSSLLVKDLPRLNRIPMQYNTIPYVKTDQEERRENNMHTVNGTSRPGV